MILVTVRERLGPSQKSRRDGPKFETFDGLAGFATRLGLGPALLRLREYELWYRERHSDYLELNLSVVAVSAIDDLSAAELEAGSIELIEELPRPFGPVNPDSTL